MVEMISNRKDNITFLSFTLIIIGLFFGLTGDEPIKNIVLIIATVTAGVPIFIKAYQALTMKAFSIELLVCIAIVGGLFIKEYNETSIVSFLFLFGDYLELRTLEKTRASIRGLVEQTPKEARVLRNGEYIAIPFEKVVEGDRIMIRPGGKVPVDGRIAYGHASLMEAAITGESALVRKKLEDKVYCGTLVDDGYIEIIAEKVGNTVILVATEQKLAGMISIADEIRKDAADALAELRKNGIKRMVMLTGDNKHTAQLVSEKLRLDEFHAELLPENKVEYVKKLKKEGHVVAMAGDGINDAPAIATADIGLAIGKGGAEISMETADIVLMSDKLMQFAHGYVLSKATIRNMKQNTYFAISTAVLLLIGVLFDTIHLASGMFIHESSVLLVILNAMRLIQFNHQRVSKIKTTEDRTRLLGSIQK